MGSQCMYKKIPLLLFLFLFLLPIKTVFAEENSYIPVLMYHHFEEGGNTSTIVDPDVFREQLSYLKEQGYETITEQELLLFIEEGKKLPEKPILITIDDGYLSNYTYAYPILKELEMKATIFVVTDWRTKTSGLLYPHFNWVQAKEMVDSGYIDIQSHTYNSHYKVANKNGGKKYPVLTTKLWLNNQLETQEQYEARIRNDLQLAKNTIENEVGNEVTSIAFPYGAYNDSVIRIAQEENYKLMYTINRGVTYPKSNPDKIHRINVPAHYTGADIVRDIQYYASKQKPNGTYITINDGLLNSKVFEYNQTEYIPLREAIEKMGLELKYDVQTKNISVMYKGTLYSFKVNSNKYQINGVETKINATPILNKGVTYIPTQFFSDILQLNVTKQSDWLGSLKRIEISDKK